MTAQAVLSSAVRMTVKKKKTGDAAMTYARAAGAPRRGMLDHLVGFHLRRAQQKLFQHFRKTFQAQGISPGQAGILILVHNNPGLSQAALARALNIERATLGEVLDGLASRGWIQRRTTTRDRRAKALYLSPEGTRFLEGVLPRIEAHEQAVVHNLTARESAQLIRLLRKFVDGL